MARVIREEWQDKEGNVHYPHTEDIVVFDEDGSSLRDAMKKVQFEDYTGAAALPSIETAMADIVKNKKWTSLFSSIKAVLKGLVAKSQATEDDLGDAFSATKAYAAGDYAIYENMLYKFTTAKAAGAWDASKAQAVTVASELCELNGKIQYSTKAVPDHMGTYGAYNNVICGHAKIGNFIMLFFKGHVRGTTDIAYSAFGLNYTLPPTLEGLRLATADGVGGNSQIRFVSKPPCPHTWHHHK